MSKKIKIGVIDSGVNDNIVPDVQHVYKSGYDDFNDYLEHGTSCARLILNRCPGSEIYNLKVFDKKLLTNAGNIINAINWCVENDIRLINLSLSIPDPDYYYDFYEVCEYAIQKNVFIVASADSIGRPCVPAYLDNVFGVGTANLAEEGEFFYVGGNIQLYANGNKSDNPADSKDKGTSFAAARITGVIAAILNVHPELTFDELKLMLEQKASRLDPNKPLRKNIPFNFEEQKFPFEIAHNCDFKELGVVTFIGTEEEVTQWTLYEKFLLLEKINFIEVKLDILTAANILEAEENFIIKTPQFEKITRESDSLIIGDIPPKALSAILREAKASDKKIYFLSDDDRQAAKNYNIDGRYIYDEFWDKKEIIDRLNRIPAGYIAKNKIPIMALINISGKRDIFDIELTLMYYLH